MANLLTALILAAWVIAIAIISVQNATPVSIRFLTFQSIEIPFGLILAFSAALGMLGMAILLPVWRVSSSIRSRSSSSYTSYTANETSTDFSGDEDW